jgi:hypothetical protein
MANGGRVPQDTERAHERLKVAQLEVFAAWCSVYMPKDARAVKAVADRVRRRVEGA